MTKANPSLVINCSRVGSGRSGLATATRVLIRCFEGYPGTVTVVRAQNTLLDTSRANIAVSPLFSITKRISYVRPILWLLYATMRFPKSLGRVVGTTHHVVPRIARQIVTVHDIRPYFRPDSIMQWVYFRFLLKRALRQIDGVLTVSRTTKRILEDTYGLDPARVFVVPNAIPIEKHHPVRRTHEAPYLLLVGANEPHKNAHEFIRSHGAWSRYYRAKIVCADNRYTRWLKRLARANAVENLVDFLSEVSDAELASLYQNAVALVYPSEMEGFGLPPLEAMACGTPAIVSDIPVFKESYGDAALYLDSSEGNRWDNALSVLRDEAQLETLRRKGLSKVSEYTIARTRSALREAITQIWPDIEWAEDQS